MVKKSNSFQIVKIFLILILILIHSCISKNQEIVRNENGNIILKCELKKGIRDGKCYQYYPNGVIEVISNWIAGFQDGETIEYFENGKVKSTSMWKEGKQDGETIEYFENGKEKTTGMWKYGKADGEFVWYSEDGRIKEKIYCVNDHPRKHDLYDENGRVQKINFFITINHKPRLNRYVVYDTENASDYPNNVILEETRYAHIVADRDTIDYGGFAEYEVDWMCDEKYVRAITGNIDHDFNVVDSISLKVVDFDNKNKFYPSNMKSDTLRIIFEFIKFENGKSLSFETFLEKVFTVIEKSDKK